MLRLSFAETSDLRRRWKQYYNTSQRHSVRLPNINVPSSLSTQSCAKSNNATRWQGSCITRGQHLTRNKQQPAENEGVLELHHIESLLPMQRYLQYVFLHWESSKTYFSLGKFKLVYSTLILWSMGICRCIHLLIKHLFFPLRGPVSILYIQSSMEGHIRYCLSLFVPSIR